MENGTSVMLIRQAKSTKDDALHYVRLAAIAADGMFEMLYGAKYQFLQETLYLDDKTSNSYLNTWFAEVDGEVAGAVTCYSYSTYQQSAKYTEDRITRLLGWRIIRLLLTLLMLWILRINLHGVQKDELYIESIAVYEDYRGRKLGSNLLRKVDQLAIELNCNSISLDVDRKNEIAIAAYMKNGFQVDKKGKIWKMKKMLL